MAILFPDGQATLEEFLAGRPVVLSVPYHLSTADLGLSIVATARHKASKRMIAKCFSIKSFAYKPPYREMTAQAYEPADVWVVRTLCKRYPDLQRQRAVPALGTKLKGGRICVWRWRGFLGERRTIRTDRERAPEITLVPESGGWESRYVFIGMMPAK